MVAITKRDTAYTPECQAGALQLQLNSQYQKLEAERLCYQPEALPKTQHEYIIRCESSKVWQESCVGAGGEVCHVAASVYGRYGGDSSEDATYNWDADICIPVPCKKGNNIKLYEEYFVGYICPLAGLTKCKMDVICGKAPAKVGFIIGMIILALVLANLIGFAGFLLYKRYMAHRNTEAGSPDAAPFAEYSELAQYEKEDDAFISDTSGIDDEEEHSIN